MGLTLGLNSNQVTTDKIRVDRFEKLNNIGTRLKLMIFYVLILQKYLTKQKEMYI